MTEGLYETILQGFKEIGEYEDNKILFDDACELLDKANSSDYIKSGTVENHTNIPKGGYSRQTKDAIHDVIDDEYEIVESSKYTQKHLNQNIKSSTQKDKYVNISHGKQKFGVHIFNEDPKHLSFQITEIHPYDDAEYTWAKVEPSGNILYIRDGKITNRSHVWLYDDYDYERPEDYIDDVLDDIATDLIGMNKDVKPVMVHW